MSGSGRRAILGVLALAAVLSLFGVAHGAKSHGSPPPSADGSFATAMFDASGPNHAITQQTGSHVQHAVGQLGILGATATLIAIAALWHLVASSEGRDAALGSLGIRWRRRGPPNALLLA